MRFPFLPAAIAFLVEVATAQAPINGPMPGYADLTAAKIWLQCHRPSRVALSYWDEERPDSVMRTEELFADPATGLALTFSIGDLLPGRTYNYRVWLDGAPVDLGETLRFRTQPLWRWRGDPPPFKVATGSCAYINEAAYDRPGKPYGGDYQIFNSIADQRPDLMLWLGDNIYLREPDWGSWSGIVHRYSHMRSRPEMQRLLRGTEHVAIWDDHDFGSNDADASFVNAPLTRKAFDLFWANPSSGVPGVDGITTMFQYADIDFFLLDDRSFRVPAEMVTTEPTLLGQAQIDWLIQALKYSRAPFKLVALGGQFLTTEDAYENYATFPKERQRIIDRIAAEGITGVIFITGDHHFSELSELALPDGNLIRDLTVSPLTSTAYKATAPNDLMVPGTHVEERNFAVLEFSGPLGHRSLRITVHNADGKQLWERTIDQPASH